MATLEQLVYELLSGDATIVSLVTKWNGLPAIFREYAIENADPDWLTAPPLPRIDFFIDRFEDPVINSTGTIEIQSWAKRGTAIKPEQIDKRVRTLLDNAAFHPDEGNVGVRWMSSEVYGGN